MRIRILKVHTASAAFGRLRYSQQLCVQVGQRWKSEPYWSPDHLVRSWTETELSAGLLLSLSRQIFAFNHLFNL